MEARRILMNQILERIKKINKELLELDWEWSDIESFWIECMNEAMELSDEKTQSGQAFESLCDISVDTKSDMYVFSYAGKEQFRSKSKFECRIKMKELQQSLKA